MKKIILSITALALASASYAQTLDRSIRPKAGPAPEIKLGKTESFTLPNGMKVFVVENHKLPTIAVSVQLDIKPELEGNKTGMMDMMSELLLTGTTTRSNDKLNEEIDFIGADINASHDGISGRGLKKHQDKIFDLMSDIAMNTKLTQEELEKVKTRTLSGMEAEENNPDQMLQKVTAAINYGKGHPYGEVATKETIKNIDIAFAQKYYSTYFRPNVAYMAIVGDITLGEARSLVEKYFGKWTKGNVPVAKYADPKAPAKTRVIVVPRDAAVQSVVNVTYPVNLQPGTPDVIKAKVANSILGGGSNGRLFLNLREAHGWTYGSYSSITQDDLKGNVTAYAKARNAVTDSSVNEMIAEMNKMRNATVGSEELQNHLTNMSGAFAIGLENPATVAQYAINIERYKMPKDYYQNYLKSLAAVTAADVQATAKKYIDPAIANIIVVGSKDEIAEKLKRFDGDGTVEFFDTYGNPVKAAEKTSTAATANVTASDVMKKYINAIGGEKALNSIKDMKVVMEGEFQGQKLTLTEIKKAPNKTKQIVAMGAMTLQKMVFDGAGGYQEAQGQKQNLEGDDLKDAQEKADILADLHPEKYGIKRTLSGIEQVNGKDAYKVEAVKGDDKTIEFYEVATGLLVKKIESADMPDGSSISLATEFGDYKEVPGSNGYKVPNTIKVPLGPGMNMDAKLISAEVNKNIDDAEFQ
ncbi:MAG TPA: pitrilysin family protein [Flavipsychrobacter sp.]|nr:pitrilysin family protein [Flavipsychrobacter sp.]